MSGKWRWKENVGRISGRLLYFMYHYSAFFGVLSFGVKRNDAADCTPLVAYKRNWFKWFCLLTRFLCSSLYCYCYGVWALRVSHGYMTLMFEMRLLGCLICTICIFVLQLFYQQRIIDLVNGFFRIFRRIHLLSGGQKNGFGDRLEMILLSTKLLSLAYVICLIHLKATPMAILTILCDIYTSVGTSMIMHACFVGFLSIGVLYSDLNHFAYKEFHSGKPQSLRESRAMRLRLEECLDIYDEIQDITSKFQRIFEVPLFLTLVQSLSTMALISYDVIIRNAFRNLNLWGLFIKMFIDVLLLTLAVHSAVSNYRVIRRLSLENYFVNQSKYQHKEMEMFLNRLHFNDLRVRPLGLFEVSNELTLFFLSAMITYLAFLLQYGVQLEQF
ncbi:putative gustatory receptor 93b [Drosophila tropicalis]|uniref:putative gustatory receptor 93b n=1 Tax=Drosophila tropicalis TaxID=46794 RepID=UPI0035AC0243